MTIAVLGATGATGRHLVALALARGHDVVAPVRRTGLLDPAPGLREVAWRDVSDVDTLTDGIRLADVVVSTLGGASKGPTTVCTDAARALVPAMNAGGTNRLIAVSAHGVLETHDRSLYSRAVWLGVRERMTDKEGMEGVISASELAWTIVRAPALRNAPATGRYRTGERLPIRLWNSIGRADLADFLLREAEAPAFVHGRPRIHA
jgi:putative NADH-flavin reductase